MIKKWLLGDAEKAQKESYIWNMIASVINAAEAVIVLMVAMRTVGIEMTGILTISFTVANLMMCIGKYGVRSYQVTDTTNEFSFKDYHATRFVTLLFMFLGTAFYLSVSLLFRGYTAYKGAVIFFVTLIYGIEAYEDVFVSELQRKFRLDIGTKMFSVRWLFTLLAWFLFLIVTKDALISTLLTSIVDFALFIYFIIMIKSTIICDKSTNGGIEIDKIQGIIRRCFPLFVSALTSIYIPNAPKYAIDRFCGDVDQASYGFISMPVFVVDVIAFVIFQPILPKLAVAWNENEFRRFGNIIKKTVLMITMGGFFVLVVGSWIGIPVLSLVYGIDLSNVKTEFIILLFSGIALGYIGFLYSVLTIIRRQKYLMVSYVVAAVLTVFSSAYAVKGLGIIGASAVNVVNVGFLLVMLLVGTIIFISGDINKARKK